MYHPHGWYKTRCRYVVDAVVEICVSWGFGRGHESMGEFIRFCGCAVVTMLVQECAGVWRRA